MIIHRLDVVIRIYININIKKYIYKLLVLNRCTLKMDLRETSMRLRINLHGKKFTNHHLQNIYARKIKNKREKVK